MGDGLSISGGAGGITANYEDMVSYANLLDEAGDELRSVSGSLAGLLVDGDLLQATALCPGEVAGVLATIDSAATGHRGALWTSVELEVAARYLRTSVDVLQFTDEQLARAEELWWDAAGFTAGAVLPAAALALLVAAAQNPALAAQLYLNRDALLADVQETLYDNPWLMEALSRMAPGLVQGGAFSLAALLPGGPLLLATLSDGNWPTGDYASSVAGLLALARLAGHFEDTGDFRVDRVGEAEEIPISPDSAIRTIFQQQGLLSSDPGQVQVIAVGHPPSYIVQIPGTQVLDTQRGDNPIDNTTNLTLSAGQEAIITDLVAEAMRRADIPAGAPVMLTGHSQGGITAMTMASDPGLRREFNVTSVVTGGSPVGRFDVPDHVSVVSLEHTQDFVPMLDGTANPDRSNWTTVRRALSDSEGTDRGARGPVTAHSTGNYASTGSDVDASTDPGIEAWRRQNEHFFAGTGTSTRYQITPEQP
ncbi:hypothetical protein HMPREF0063_12705 [Aeromicrobium marinum DSM 15272]|uniref:PGAP1-like protein n=1 Tax=Aeromicrobium marinum DSM 15272 TaxID=585531 RepID=E2SF96_9ACTN|nr:hypothetical protein [Aeromicrobium marinum]EFQ82181.1 hypothetical protein HMPREF0063_12705 [Aeromicrobium marinum DSM 15272]